MKFSHSLEISGSHLSVMTQLLYNAASLRGCCKAFLFLHVSFLSVAQSEIPLSAWRLHISYNNTRTVAISDQRVFGAAENGVAVLDRSDNSLTTYTKLNGLH